MMSFKAPSFWFPFCTDDIGKHNKMFCNFLFRLYHKTKLQLSGRNISAHSFQFQNPGMKKI